MTTPLPCITRHDYKKTHGYVVRYSRDTALFQKLFSDSIYGSKELALKAATDYLRELREAFPPMNRQEYCQINRNNNKAGIVGVYKSSTTSRGHRYDAWVASWSPQKGVHKQKSYAINKYGEDEAKRLAIEARKAGLREMELNWPEEYREYIEGQERASRELEQYRHKVFDNEPFGHEGNRLYRMHITRERDKTLRKLLLERFLEAHGYLYCEVCSFSFEEQYGVLGEGLIEVHHKRPLATLDAEDITELKDLMLICSNCHYVIHSGDAGDIYEKLLSIFSGRTRPRKRK